MLNLTEILSAYPEGLQIHRAFVLREYLQYKILEILFDGPYASKFYDIVFLLSKSVKPNYDYLRMKLGISNSGQLRERIRDLYARTNIEEMVADVSPFLFYPADEKKIRLFLPIVEQADLG